MIKAILVLFFLFIFDNLLVIFLPIQPIFDQYTIVPYLMVMGLCMATFFDEKKWSIWLAVVFGFLYDSYFFNITGLFMTLLPLVVLLIKKFIVNVTPFNFISVFYVISITILSLEFIVYILIVIITSRTNTLFAFIGQRLLITLVFNSLLLGLLYVPLKKILQPKDERKVKTIMTDNTSA